MADFTGTSNPDLWFGTSGSDTAHGGGGGDTLYGNDGNDALYGEAGNDYLAGGIGDDLVDGGDGDDILAITIGSASSELSAGDQFVGGSGVDTLYVRGSFYPIYDFTAISVAADIERIQTVDCTVRIGFARFAQFSSIDGVFRLVGSGSLDLTGNRMSAGLVFCDTGNDSVTMAGNVTASPILLSGGDGDDQLIGSESPDILQGDAGDDRLEGRAGIDSLTGGAGNDVMIGGDGDDSIYDGAGNDAIDAGAGNDTVFLDFANGFSAADQVSGGAGVDWLEIASTPGALSTIDLTTLQIADDFEGFRASWARVVASAERIGHFQSFEALVLSLTTAGNFTVSANFQVHDVELSDFGNGIDLSAGTPGPYYVVGGAGADVITGSAVIDGLYGRGGDDLIHAGGGQDTLSGGAGIDWIDGGGGDDQLLVEETESISAGDRFTGGSGIDTLFVGGQTYNGPVRVVDLSIATVDADVERLEGANYSGARATIAQLNGFSRIYLQEIYLTVGGAIDFTGKETRGYLYLNDAGNQVTISAAGFYAVFGGAAADTVFGAAQGDEIRGNGGDDVLNGGDGSDFLVGGDGNDILRGGGIGSIGVNALWGGNGNDLYYLDSPDMIAGDGVGQGYDVVIASLSYVLTAGAEIELLTTVNPAALTAINLTGNEFAQEVSGNAGNNVLDGGGGADRLTGGLGDDIYVVDHAGDTVVENAGAGTDEIRTTLASYSIASLGNIENLTGTASSGQSLTGNSGANVIRSGGGNDTLIGLAGSDSYHVNNAGDAVTEAAGAGEDRVFAGADYTLGAGQYVEILSTESDAGTAPIALAGNELDNIVLGNAGANLLGGGGGLDRIDGGAGADRLNGGAGFDRLTGGVGADVFLFTAAGDSQNLTFRSDGAKFLPDQITDFHSGEDRIDLSAIDAITGTAGDDAFTFIGAGAFTHQAGQLRCEAHGAQMFVFGDVDGNGSADFQIVVTTPILIGADFVL